jgi:hypothetical protein
MPPNERVGPHDHQQFVLRNESEQQNECHASGVVRALRPNLAFDVGGELLPEEQVLRREVRARSERRSQQSQQVSEQGKRSSDHVRRSYMSGCGVRFLAEYNYRAA